MPPSWESSPCPRSPRASRAIVGKRQTVGRIDTKFGLPGGNDRYGVDLIFAKDKTGAACRFCYSIEPMCPEPSGGLYKKFLLVKEGQKVRKGDVIAHLYTPPSSGDGCHIHFHLMIDGKKGFLAPAIFTPEIVEAFHKQCQGFKGCNDGKLIPPCMGYRIGARKTRLGAGRKKSYEEGGRSSRPTRRRSR